MIQLVNMSDMCNKIAALRDGINNNSHRYNNEEQTKQSLIFPFFTALGYDISNPNEVQFEYELANGRVDCVIMDGDSSILVECKKFGTKLDMTVIKQMEAYFNSCRTDNKVGVVTNGDEYLFSQTLTRMGLWSIHLY